MLDKLANWKTVLVIFVVAVVLFNVILFPWRTSQLGAGPIDVMFAYTPDQVYAKLPGYGDQGRPLYALTEATIDLVYPILYSLFLILTMTLVFRQAFPSDSAVHKLRFLPFVAWASDYAENICIVILLLSYPQRLDALAWVSSFFSTAKWSLGVVSLILIVIGLIAWLIKSVRGRRQR